MSHPSLPFIALTTLLVACGSSESRVLTRNPPSLPQVCRELSAVDEVGFKAVVPGDADAGVQSDERRAMPDDMGRIQTELDHGIRYTSGAGIAVLGLRIETDGSVTPLYITRATSRAHADACCGALAASHWTPRTSETGEALSTVIGFTCMFEK